MKSILLSLRECAKTATDANVANNLRALADELTGHVAMLYRTPCVANMQYTNGCFTRCALALEAFHIPQAPTPGTPIATELTPMQLAA
jgi:hypothetical protein